MTTALVLTTAIYHLNKQPDLWSNLQAELLSNFPDSLNEQPDIVQLEKIPLLEACIKEAMRISIPIRGRWPREVPNGGLNAHGHYLPEGVSFQKLMTFLSIVTDTRSMVQYLLLGFVLL